MFSFKGTVIYLYNLNYRQSFFPYLDGYTFSFFLRFSDSD